MKRLGILRSLKTTTVLLPLIAVSALVSSFLSPEDRADWIGGPFFLVPVLLFGVHLAACAVHRLRRAASWRHPSRLGADIIHLGLLVLIAAGLMSSVLRSETPLVLARGDSVLLEGGRRVTVEDLEFRTWADGTPRQWTARLDIDGDAAALEVNHPVRAGSYRLVLTGFLTRPRLTMDTPEGTMGLTPESPIVAGGERLELRRLESAGPGRWSAVVEVDGVERRFVEGRSSGGFTLQSVDLNSAVGILSVRDPARIPAGLALGLIGLGAGWSLVYRLRRPR